VQQQRNQQEMVRRWGKWQGGIAEVVVGGAAEIREASEVVKAGPIVGSLHNTS
jgi:hypothetical protein